ncbi:MAG: flagellar biosynthesis protein FliQ [Pseudomonadota bacterium]
MNQADALDLVREAIWTVIIASSPAVIAAMVIGIVIALFQALTQVQEMTLTFVPKIMAIFVVSIMSAHFMGASIFAMAQVSFSRIENGF